jgi:hypothetical protein
VGLPASKLTACERDRHGSSAASAKARARQASDSDKRLSINALHRRCSEILVEKKREKKGQEKKIDLDGHSGFCNAGAISWLRWHDQGRENPLRSRLIEGDVNYGKMFGGLMCRGNCSANVVRLGREGR